MDTRLFTLGVEVETDIVRSDIITRTIDKFVPKGTINFHRDASSETPTVSIGGLTVINRDTRFFSPRVFRSYGTGVELVSSVLEPEEMRKVVEGILTTLSLTGELKTSVRGATHVHVGFPNYYEWVYNLFVISVYLESFFFNIAGMGSGFRGQFNESIYCRPLTSPHCFPWNKGYFKLFNYEKMLESRPTEDMFWRIFLHRLGTVPGKYPGGRYLYMNFISLVMHNTIELRVLNNTLNPDYLMAVISFFRNIAQSAIYMPQRELEKLKQNLNASSHEKLEVMADLISAHNLLGTLDSKDVTTLHYLVDKTPNYIPNDNILSHAWEKTIIAGDQFMTDDILKYRHFISGKPKESGFLDTHQSALFEFERIERNRILCAS